MGIKNAAVVRLFHYAAFDLDTAKIGKSLQCQVFFMWETKKKFPTGGNFRFWHTLLIASLHHSGAAGYDLVGEAEAGVAHAFLLVAVVAHGDVHGVVAVVHQGQQLAVARGDGLFVVLDVGMRAPTISTAFHR